MSNRLVVGSSPLIASTRLSRLGPSRSVPASENLMTFSNRLSSALALPVTVLLVVLAALRNLHDVVGGHCKVLQWC